FASSLAAALLDGLSEQPTWHPDLIARLALSFFPEGGVRAVNALLGGSGTNKPLVPLASFRYSPLFTRIS
ncbi:MAG: hypothetical protein MRJ92_16865, partial [Nitrospira sp.]|nr:hypothetical protein [Nitrospira sp.]